MFGIKPRTPIDNILGKKSIQKDKYSRNNTEKYHLMFKPAGGQWEIYSTGPKDKMEKRLAFLEEDLMRENDEESELALISEYQYKNGSFWRK